jgi:probable phosphoglycerate mutase
VERIFLTRHGESELSLLGLLNGDPRVPCGLTERGEAQARELGLALASESIELAVSSDFERCRLTVEIALADRGVRLIELETLRDIHDGDYDGGPIEECFRWAHRAPAAERPPGRGESRTDVARRLAAGLRQVLARSERTVLVVSHQLPVAYVLSAAEGKHPVARLESVPYAKAFEIDSARLGRAAAVLEAWAANPDW